MHDMFCTNCQDPYQEKESNNYFGFWSVIYNCPQTDEFLNCDKLCFQHVGYDIIDHNLCNSYYLNFYNYTIKGERYTNITQLLKRKNMMKPFDVECIIETNFISLSFGSPMNSEAITILERLKEMEIYA